MIEIKQVSKSFGQLPVLSGIDLAVGTGDVVALLGPSGAGKTTLLRCINFLERADSGVITIGDLTVSCSQATARQILALRRRTAMVFQNYNLFRHKTVLENVMEGLTTVQKMQRTEARDKSLAMLEKVGLIDRRDAYPAQLSGGQQQRAGIARALALDPEIILFDEPTSALDPELVGEVLKVIKRIAEEGVTMMVVTHELAFARDVSTQTVFMANGSIVEHGKTSELFHRPSQERTQRFLRQSVPGSVG